MPEAIAVMSDAELTEMAHLDAGNCVHDPMLGRGTHECPTCNARRELWRRRDA